MAKAVSGGQSPTIDSTALFGHVVGGKNACTSSTVAAFRSSIEPISVCPYGWSAGKVSAISRSHRVAVRDVVVALPLLLLDHLALVVQVGLGQRVQQRAEPVRLQPQGEVEAAAGQRLEVVGAIEPGGGVDRGAGRLQQPDVLAGRDTAPSPGTSRARTGARTRSGRVARARDPTSYQRLTATDGARVVGAGDHPQPVVERCSVDRVRGDWHVPHGSVEIMVIADELLLLAIDDRTEEPGCRLDPGRRPGGVPGGGGGASERISIAPAGRAGGRRARSP